MFDSTVTIPLTQGQETIVDTIDADLATLKWYARWQSSRYYAGRNDPKNPGRSLFLHRIVLSRVIRRSLTQSEYCDHIDGNSLNNVRSNLRLATKAQNNRNMKKPSHNTSGYKGVSWRKNAGRWRAYIFINNKQIHLGYFDTPEEAHAAYCEAAKELHGEFARFE